MREIRMEVVSESEAREYCNTHGYAFEKCYMGRGKNLGCLMMLAYAPGEDISDDEIERMYEYQQIIEQPKDTVIRAFYDNNFGKVIYIYVSARTSGGTGVTFELREAKRFTFEKAKVKARKMREYGRYAWEVHRIKSR